VIGRVVRRPFDAIRISLAAPGDTPDRVEFDAVLSAASERRQADGHPHRAAEFCQTHPLVCKVGQPPFAGVTSSLSPDDLFFIPSCLRRRGGFHVSTTPGLPVVPMPQCRTGPLRRWTGVVVRLSAVRACVAPALTRNHQIASRSTAACRFSRSARSFNRRIVSSVTDIPVESEELDAAGLSAPRGVRPSVQSLVGVGPAGGGGSMDFSNTSRVHSFGDRLLTQVRYAYSAHSLKVTR
jgi:hypothetical protein